MNSIRKEIIVIPPRPYPLPAWLHKKISSLITIGGCMQNGIAEIVEEEYKKHSPSNQDMGKSCIRFRKPEQIPYKLIGELKKKICMEDWIRIYESNLKRKTCS
ncbi:MAG TPA: hypothetical protein VFX58_03605 [Chitinophagaceae bacterium]|nr:hypothetical protein [Chitinophagaceae bacterium]